MLPAAFAAGVVVAAALVAAGWAAWRALRPPPVPIAVVARGWAVRRRWRRILGDGVRRLQRLVPPPPGADLALVAAAWLPEGRRAMATPLPRRGDGRAGYVVRLALAVEGRPLAADEVLAALAEQYLACALAPRSRAARPATVPPAAAADQLSALLGELGVGPDGAAHGP